MTLTPIGERLAAELSHPFLQLRSVAVGNRTPNLPLAGPFNPLRHRRGLYMKVVGVKKEIMYKKIHQA